MRIREDVLALAGELEGVSLKDDCESCLASGTSLCRGDLECAESAHKACAKRLREIVERDACEGTTMSAYDLLPEDEREAIAWVREQGGLEAVKASAHQGAVEHGYLLKIAEMLGTSIYDGTDNADTLLDKLEKRLMPAGCEWPRFEDGERVRIGGCWGEDGCDTSITYIERIIFAEDGVYLDNEYNEAFCRHGERVKRPAPKVLDADGVEIRVGDTVYHVKDGSEMTVYGIEGEWLVVSVGGRVRHDIVTHRAPVLAADGKPLEAGQTVWDVESGTEYEVVSIYIDEENPVRVMRTDGSHLAKATKPSTLTHQRPVLDADGVPIKEGDTVYLLPGEWCDRFPCLGFYGGEELNVIDLNPKHGVSGSIKCYKADKMTGLCYPQSSQLTHTKPEIDSWERIEEDCSISERQYYAQRIGHDVGLKDDEEVHVAVSRDLVRRCRALAEKENRNE